MNLWTPDLIEVLMPLATNRIQGQPRRLRKSLKKVRKNPSVPQVHELRTRARRLEATLHALSLDSRKNERLLLKAIKPVRKEAGKVRDRDVLIEFASGIRIKGETECSVLLLEKLGGQREKHACKLQDAT